MDALTDNKFLLGIMVLVVNVGSRHLIDEFSLVEEEYRRNIFLRRFAIFAICFMTTRDISTSILLTAGLIIFASGFSRVNPEGMANKKPDYKGVAAFDMDAPPLFKKD